MAAVATMDQLPEKVVHDLLNFGVLLMGVTPYNNLTMKNIVLKLFDGSAESATVIEKIVTPALASANPQANVTDTLGGLATYIMTRNPYTNGAPTTNRTFLILTLVTFVFIALRFYSRQFLTGKIRLDDWVMLLAFVSFSSSSETY